MRRSLIIGVGIFFLVLFQPVVIGAFDFDIWLTADEKGKVPIDIVDISSGRDPIFCLVVLSGLSPGEHQVSFFWQGGLGKEQSQYIHDFQVHQNIKKYCYFSWLKLHPDESFWSFSEGYENLIGEWEVSVYLDGEYLGVKEFSVR